MSNEMLRRIRRIEAQTVAGDRRPLVVVEGEPVPDNPTGRRLVIVRTGVPRSGAGPVAAGPAP